MRRRLSDLDRDVVGFAFDAGRVAPKDGRATPRWGLDLLRRALLPVARLSRGAGVSDPDAYALSLYQDGSIPR